MKTLSKACILIAVLCVPVHALLANDAVTGSVPPEFPEAFDKNLEGRGSLAWAIMQGAQAAE